MRLRRRVMSWLLVLAGPALTLAGAIKANSNPCFLGRVPAAYCNASNNGPGGLAVALMAAGAAISVWVTVRIIIIARAARRRQP